MVQINLPENSKVKKGKYYKDTTGSKNIKKVNIYRWDPSSGENPRIDTYEVDMDNCPSKVVNRSFNSTCRSARSIQMRDYSTFGYDQPKFGFSTWPTWHKFWGQLHPKRIVFE